MQEEGSDVFKVLGFSKLRDEPLQTLVVNHVGFVDVRRVFCTHFARPSRDDVQRLITRLSFQVAFCKHDEIGFPNNGASVSRHARRGRKVGARNELRISGTQTASPRNADRVLVERGRFGRWGSSLENAASSRCKEATFRAACRPFADVRVRQELARQVHLLPASSVPLDLETTMNLSSYILRSTSCVMFFAMSLYGLGCIAEPGNTDEEHLGHAELGIAGDPTTQNHLRHYVLMNHGVQHSTRALGNGALVNAHNQLPSMPYMPAAYATGDLAGARVEFLEVLIGCALTSDQTVIDPGHTLFILNGIAVKKSYAGEIGLAPDWKTRALTTTEKKWVTACVLARTNRYGATINILLSGNHSALNYRSGTTYTEAESSAWGNMFDSTTVLNTTNPGAVGLPFNAYICSHVSWCADPYEATMRACDEEYTPCGFSYMQNCDTFYDFCNSMAGVGHQACIGRAHAIKIFLKSSDATCP